MSRLHVGSAELIANVETRQHRGESLARLVHAEKVGDGFTQCLRALVLTTKRDRSHRVTQNPGSDRVALGVIRVQQGFGCGSVDHLRQLPSQIHRVLHADLESLPAVWWMHMRGVTGEKNSSIAIGRGLPSRVRESGDRAET